MRVETNPLEVELPSSASLASKERASHEIIIFPCDIYYFERK
jgi:hypothetical protein